MRITILAVMLTASALLGAEPYRKMPYYFTDETIALPVAPKRGHVTYTMQVLTRDGLGPIQSMKGEVKNRNLVVKPVAEGIHIVRLGKEVFRFLAMAPPQKLTLEKVSKQLTQQGRTLMAGQPFTILAMGDSVTATGHYEHLLAKMLSRATGNSQIKVVTAGYPGRSVDAAVREFKNDALPVKPHLGLLMYGLNDQVCFTPLPAYLEQSAHVVRRLRKDCNADAILLEPTPHIDLREVPHFAFRTIGFAQSLNELAQELAVPIAPTFGAIWGDGGETVEVAAKKMWPLYPPQYSKQMESLLEVNGKGDTIHPNALGHLQLAKAVFSTIAGETGESPLSFKGESEWAAGGVVSHITVQNRSGKHRIGRLEVHPLLDGKLLPEKPIAYDLKPGAASTFTVTWPQATSPKDLLRHPANCYVAPGALQVPILDVANSKSHVFAVPAPLKGAQFQRERQVVVGNKVCVRLADGTTVSHTIPKNTQVDRIPLIRGNAVAELAYVQYGAAIAEEASPDGELSEWRDAHWSVVGEKCQARWVKGPEDHRVKLKDCYLRFAVRAGMSGLTLAFQIDGNVAKDSFTLYFDPRPAAELGTAGPYYWCSGQLADSVRIKLQKGETTKTAVRLKGVWRRVGTQTVCELVVPYALMEQEAWPSDGDLGFSLVWQHKHEDGKVTRLMWAEDGHPWNTRWYGVLRKVNTPDAPLPYRVRVK